LLHKGNFLHLDSEEPEDLDLADSLATLRTDFDDRLLVDDVIRYAEHRLRVADVVEVISTLRHLGRLP
jgi:hypothetical protein